MIRLSCLIFSLGLFTLPVLAQDSSSTTSSVSAPAGLPANSSVQVADKLTTNRRGFKITYFGDIAGPMLTDSSNPYLKEANVERSGWYHEPGIDYRLRDGLSLKVKFPFTINSTPSRPEGPNYESDDMAFGIADSGLVRTDNFNLYAGFKVSPAMTDYSLSRQRMGDLGITLIPSYEFGNSGFKLEFVSSFKKYIYVTDNQMNAKTKAKRDGGTLSELKLEYYPALLYAITDKFSAVLGGHWVWINSRNQNSLTFNQIADSVHVGASYKFSSALSIRPEIRIHEPGPKPLDYAEAGMLIFGSIQ